MLVSEEVRSELDAVNDNRESITETVELNSQRAPRDNSRCTRCMYELGAITIAPANSLQPPCTGPRKDSGPHRAVIGSTPLDRTANISDSSEI